MIVQLLPAVLRLLARTLENPSKTAADHSGRTPEQYAALGMESQELQHMLVDELRMCLVGEGPVGADGVRIGGYMDSLQILLSWV